MKKINDKARLDWLADPNHGLFVFLPQMSGGVFLFEGYAATLGGNQYKGMYFKSLRKAIDAAMRAPKP